MQNLLEDEPTTTPEQPCEAALRTFVTMALKRQRERPHSQDATGADEARSVATAADGDELCSQLGLPALQWRARVHSALASSYARAAPPLARLKPAWDSRHCTFQITGTAGAPQQLMRCLTCAMDRICTGCCRSCHAGHAMVAVGSSGASGWCQCGSSGKCRADNALRAPEPLQNDAEILAEACEAVLCWGCGEDVVREGLASASDDLGFVELSAVVALAKRLILPGSHHTGERVALASVVTALQCRGLCRFQRIGSAAVSVSPRHPHAPQVVFRAVKHLAEALRAAEPPSASASSASSASASASDWTELNLSRSGTLPDTLGTATLLGSAEAIQSAVASAPVSFGGAGLTSASHLPMVRIAGTGILGAIRARLARSIEAARWTTGQWRAFFKSGHSLPARSGLHASSAPQTNTLTLPGPPLHPGHARYEERKLQRLQEQRLASRRVAKRLARPSQTAVAPGAAGQLSESDTTRSESKAALFAPEEEEEDEDGDDDAVVIEATGADRFLEAFGVLPVSKTGRVVIVAPSLATRAEMTSVGEALACSVIKERGAPGAVGEFHQSLRAASDTPVAVGLSLVVIPGSSTVGGLAVSVRGRSIDEAVAGSARVATPSAPDDAGDDDMDLATQIDSIIESHGAGVSQTAGSAGVIVALTGTWWERARGADPAPFPASSARRGVDPTGDRDTTHCLAPVLLDGGIVKASHDVGGAAALLSADVGQHLVNTLDIVVEQASTEAARPPCRTVAACIQSADEASASAMGCLALPATRQAALARCTSQLLALATVPADWASQAVPTPPLTVAPWFVRCRTCTQHGHFTIDCPTKAQA
jgi:hypothetical protein